MKTDLEPIEIIGYMFAVAFVVAIMIFVSNACAAHNFFLCVEKTQKFDECKQIFQPIK